MNRSRLLLCVFTLCGLIAPGCSQETDSGQKLPGPVDKDAIQYFAPGPEFKREREAAAKKEASEQQPLKPAAEQPGEESRVLPSVCIFDVDAARQSEPEMLTAARQREPEILTVAPDSETYNILAQAAGAYRTKLSVIANNLANTQTIAFKSSRVLLESASYRHEQQPGTQDSVGEYAPVGISVGLGVRIAGMKTDFCQGAFEVTGSELDVAIVGQGFFQVSDSSGDVLYTRAGTFSKNANGAMVMASASVGRLLEPPITIPVDATQLTISSDGIASVLQPGSQTMTQVGQIQLATFVNPQGLLKRGENLYAETDASGSPTTGNPGQDAMGTLRQGTLEASNVQPEHEHAEWNRTAATLKRINRLLQVE
ncbi:MAG: flagellar hook-basal body complex protein [Candidatus Nealsonbacteria bacterium]|nr:flagellar hook-basal body complex protein [Candidatus Nealsonbacteria bacterium]